MNFPEKDKIFLQLRSILPQPTKIIVGVSGGPDSRFVFSLLQDYYKQQGWDQELLIVAHFHHGQRKESDQELKQIYSRYRYHHIYYNTNRPKKGSNETKLRSERMKFFHEVCEKEKATYVATGHNLDDRIETSFMNLLRGTSLEGLGNMNMFDYKEGLFFVRPLLGLQKQYIEELCKVYDIAYFTDLSNKNSSLTMRNALRNDIFPQITRLSPQNKWYDSWSLIYLQIEKSAQRLETDSIWMTPKHQHPSRNAEFCYEINKPLSRGDNEYTQTDRMFIFKKLDIYKNVSQKTLAERERFSNTSRDGYKFLAGVFFFVAHTKIYAIKSADIFREKESSLSLDLKKNEKKVSFDGQEIMIKKDRVGGKVRYANQGDTYKGKRLKKRMLNQKIPIFWRNTTPVVEKKGKIIAIINLAQKYNYS